MAVGSSMQVVVRRAAGLPVAVAVAVVVVVAVTAIGCATREPPAEPAAPTAQQRRDLSIAEDILVGRCMRAQGFEYHHLPADPTLAEDRDFPYGIDDRDWAARNGLGTDIRALAAERAGASNPNQVYLDGLDPHRRQEYTVALYGRRQRVLSVTVPTGDVVTASTDGCIATAQAELYGDHARWFAASAITNNIAGAIQPAVFGDSRYATAAADWSACMSSRGYDYRDPVDLRGRFTPQSPEHERTVATAEAECVVTSGLGTTARRLEQEHGAPVRAKYAADIRACHRFQAAALPRAADLIGTGSEASD